MKLKTYNPAFKKKNLVALLVSGTFPRESNMQLSKIKTLIEATPGQIFKVAATAWSPNNKRLAVVTADRVVHLFDETGEKREKFATKAAEKGGAKNYIIRGIAFSPDSTKLAIAQSDNIIYVYKLGLEWGGRITICNKFPQSSAVTTLTWPSCQQNEIVFGLSDGKVKIGQLKTNSPAVLFSTTAYVVTLCSNRQGNMVLSGHIDGAIYRYSFENVGRGVNSYSKLIQFSCPPYSLAWGHSIIVAGSDRRVVFYDDDGNEVRCISYSGDETVKEFSIAEFNVSGQSLAVGNFDKFFVYSFDLQSQTWVDLGPKQVENYYSITALDWKKDGSQLVVGTMCGCVDLYDACVKRIRYNGKFDFTFVSLSQVIVKKLSNEKTIVIKSSAHDNEITKLDVYGEDRFVIAFTDRTLLCGDLESGNLSEIEWISTGNEKFFFDNPSICMIYASGELTLVEYGKNEILANCRTEYMNSTLVSVRINERPAKRRIEQSFIHENSGSITETRNSSSSVPNQKLAYLLDKMTIRIMDLLTGIADATVNHDAKIDWLELNARADLLLFRDKRKQLHLFNTAKQLKMTLLSFCGYAQWVPMSDVVVAQNRDHLCVWYNIEAPDKITFIPVNGEAEDIQRHDGKTEVLVDEGLNIAIYCLDEALIGFGSALEDGKLKMAMDVLEAQSRDINAETSKSEIEMMWQQLSEVALETGNLHIAERCFAAIGDIPKARYLRKTNKVCLQVKKATGAQEGTSHWLVKARLAQFRGAYREAELIYLEHGQTEDAIAMYQSLRKWEDAIRVAQERGDPEADEMQRSYFQYLLTSGQEEMAGAIREREGRYEEAIELYLQGARPAKAMNVVNTYKRDYKADVLDSIAKALTKNKMYDKAGELYERMSFYDKALDSYIKGDAYRNAVEVARRKFPAEVVRLEEAWGDWLVQNKNMEAAIGHYIEAGASRKAIEATLAARQWAKAGQLVESLASSDEDVARTFYKRIARHYRQAQQFEQAEKYFILAGIEREAIQMYTDLGQWKTAHKLAIRFMSSDEVASLYKHQAQNLEAKGKFKEAERLFLAVNAVDAAIAMYKTNRKYDQMIRLLSEHKKESLNETLNEIAKQLELDGKLKDAEEFYARAKDWQSAVKMYTSNKLWDEAIRVAQTHGGMQACVKVAYAWARTLGGEPGSKLLTELGLVDQAIDYTIESSLFEEAIQLAQSSQPSRLSEVYFRYAEYLEDEDRYQEAEIAFIKAGKPKEAIAMYNHQRDWQNAMRVAENYEPSSILDILEAQGRAAVELQQYETAEQLFLNAKRPQLVIEMYRNTDSWTDALRFAKKHAPHMLNELKTAYQLSQASKASQKAIESKTVHESETNSSQKTSNSKKNTQISSNGKSLRAIIEAAKVWEEAHEYERALETYLEISSDKIKESSTPNEDQVLIEQAWRNAIKLASQHFRHRYEDVVQEVAYRLEKLGRYNSAAEMYQEIDRHDKAVDCFLQAKNFSKAKEIGSVIPALKTEVDIAYKSYLRDQKNPMDLVKVGDFDSALAIYAENGEWDTLFSIIERNAPHLGRKYSYEFSKAILRDREIGEIDNVLIDKSVALLAVYGVPKGSQQFAIVCRLSQEVLSRNKMLIFAGEASQKSFEKYSLTLRSLREILFSSVKDGAKGTQVRESKLGEDQTETINRLLLVVHLYVYFYLSKEKEMDELASHIATTLLRFAGDIPADKIFYIAGSSCLELEWLGQAFLLLNRYIDLVDAILEQDNTLLENNDFRDTDIPCDHALPKWSYLPEEDIEETREWILGSAIKMESDVTPPVLEWIRNSRIEVNQQLKHVIRRYDKGALAIEEYLAPVREDYGLV